MAGTHHSGFSASTAELFDGACMITVPADHNDTALMDRIRRMLQPAGFSSISASPAARHDEIIAFTSQLAHVVSNAYIKSPTAIGHMGFSAGSYKDLTRVAWLDPNMWTTLFLENRDNLINEIDVLIKALTEYRIALSNNEVERLRALLDEGRRRKQEVDGGNKI